MSGNLRDQLLTIREANGGLLTTQAVVDAARDESHPLHSRFEWDDEVAGERWRREQAHRLITSVKVAYTVDDRPKDVRAFHCTERSASPTVYDPLEEIADDPVRRQIVLQQAMRDWQTLKSRYGDLAEFLELVRSDVVAA